MKILMIGAHQDDDEYVGGGLAYKLVKTGHNVRFLSCCNGSGGHHIMTPQETVKKRAQESDAVAKFLGVQYDVWDIDDCTLVADLETRRRMIRYIRNYNPDVIITHRPNDYHADHRAAGQLVQDASYVLIVPHECPETPAMRRMPVILYFDDEFTNPPFRADLIFDIDDVIDIKLQSVALHESQVYEWLPYTYEEEVPSEEADLYEWFKGMKITEDTTDEDILAAPRGHVPLFAKPAVRFRKELMEKYGSERGKKVRFAEAFEICEYGAPLTEEIKQKLFSF